MSSNNGKRRRGQRPSRFTHDEIVSVEVFARCGFTDAFWFKTDGLENRDGGDREIRVTVSGGDQIVTHYEWSTRPELLALHRYMIGSAGNASKVDLLNGLDSIEPDQTFTQSADPDGSANRVPTTSTTKSSKPKAEPKADPSPKGSPMTNTTAPPAPPAPAGSLDAMIVDMIARFGVVDEARVREIASEVAGQRPRVSVKVGERPEVDLGDVRPHYMLEKVLQVLGTGLVPMLVGPAGTGKTTLAMHSAKALGLDYGELTLSPDTDDSHFIGFRSPIDGEVYDSPAARFVRDGGVFLFDEVDQCDPASLKGANPLVRRDDRVGLVGGVVDTHMDYRPIVAANTFGFGSDDEYQGNQLDASTLDGWVIVKVGYDTDLEQAMAEQLAGDAGVAWCEKVHRIRRTQSEQRIRAVVSTRMVEHGARLIAAGFSEREAWDMTGGRYDDDVQSRLLSNVTLAA